MQQGKWWSLLYCQLKQCIVDDFHINLEGWPVYLIDRFGNWNAFKRLLRCCYVLLIMIITSVLTANEECECCASVHILSTERLGLRKWKYLGVENLFWTWTVTCKYLVHIAGIECPCCLAETLRVLTVNHLRLHYLIVPVQYPYTPMTPQIHRPR